MINTERRILLRCTVIAFLLLLAMCSDNKYAHVYSGMTEDSYSDDHRHETTPTRGAGPSRKSEPPSSEPIIYEDNNYVKWAREQYARHSLVDSPPASMIADAREMRFRSRWHYLLINTGTGYYELQMGAIKYLSIDGKRVAPNTIGGHLHFVYEGEIYTTLGNLMWRTGLAPRR